MINNISTPKNKDDLMRAIVTIYTTGQALFLILFFGAAPFLGLKMKPEESINVVELLLPIMTGYIGMMLGYYFGSKVTS
jgi:hypothetical protein